ncbi:MAG: THUMP domain-containing protein [Xanthobacteraceae bacterium]
MNDWNMVISIYQYGFKRALRALQEFGQVERSPYHNVLVMKADDPMAALKAIEQQTEESPALYDAISRVAPATRSFEFQSAEEFDEKAKSIMLEWSPRLAGRSFHARLHRRDGRHDLHASHIEQFLDEAILNATTEAGMPAKMSFTDPDAIIAVDTIDDRAGVALWTREDLARHRLLRPD